MAWRNTEEAYGSVAKFLHWSIVLLLIPQYFLAEAAEEAADGSLGQASLFGWHKSIGLLVLLLAVARIAWKMLNRPHPAPLDKVVWQRRAAAAGHGLLYLLILLQPLSGWLMASAAGAPVAMFGLPFPALLGANHDLHEALEEVHELLFDVLLVVALVHVAAALYHHFVLKDGVLRRMLPYSRGRA
jgi:cytochrome b561